jgi:predicted glycosyl hydrolase (DUF1957 family)
VIRVRSRSDITDGLGPFETEVMDFLADGFMDVLARGSNDAKLGVRETIFRMRQRDAEGMVSYFWSAIVGTERSIRFADRLRAEGFTRWEELIEEFRVRFDGKWLRKANAAKRAGASGNSP